VPTPSRTRRHADLELDLLVETAPVDPLFLRRNQSDLDSPRTETGAERPRRSERTECGDLAGKRMIASMGRSSRMEAQGIPTKE